MITGPTGYERSPIDFTEHPFILYKKQTLQSSSSANATLWQDSPHSPHGLLDCRKSSSYHRHSHCWQRGFLWISEVSIMWPISMQEVILEAEATPVQEFTAPSILDMFLNLQKHTGTQERQPGLATMHPYTSDHGNPVMSHIDPGHRISSCIWPLLCVLTKFSSGGDRTDNCQIWFLLKWRCQIPCRLQQ